MGDTHIFQRYLIKIRENKIVSLFETYIYSGNDKKYLEIKDIFLHEIKNSIYHAHEKHEIDLFNTNKLKLKISIKILSHFFFIYLRKFNKRNNLILSITHYSFKIYLIHDMF